MSDSLADRLEDEAAHVRNGDWSIRTADLMLEAVEALRLLADAHLPCQIDGGPIVCRRRPERCANCRLNELLGDTDD